MAVLTELGKRISAEIGISEDVLATKCRQSRPSVIDDGRVMIDLLEAAAPLPSAEQLSEMDEYDAARKFNLVTSSQNQIEKFLGPYRGQYLAVPDWWASEDALENHIQIELNGHEFIQHLPSDEIVFPETNEAEIHVIWKAMEYIAVRSARPLNGIPKRPPAPIRYRDLESAYQTVIRWCRGLESKLTEEASVPAILQRQLTSNREILAAVGFGASGEEWNKLRSLNDRYDGPIKCGGRGEQSFCDQNRLIEWFNGLSEMYGKKQEESKRKSDLNRVITQTSYSYGRDGQVAPEVCGSIKKVRKGRKTS